MWKHDLRVHVDSDKPMQMPLAFMLPADTQHQNDVISTSMRRDHVTSTLIQRHFNVVCLLAELTVSLDAGKAINF